MSRDSRTESAPGGAGGVALGVLSGVLGYHLSRAAVTTVDMFERHIRQRFGLRKMEFAIVLLLDANASLTPKKIGRVLTLTPPNLSLLIDRLQERGLLLRERSELDRRSQNIVLTPPGQALAREVAAAAATMETELDDRLSPAEHALLIELLGKAAAGPA